MAAGIGPAAGLRTDPAAVHHTDPAAVEHHNAQAVVAEEHHTVRVEAPRIEAVRIGHQAVVPIDRTAAAGAAVGSLGLVGAGSLVEGSPAVGVDYSKTWQYIACLVLV